MQLQYQLLQHGFDSCAAFNKSKAHALLSPGLGKLTFHVSGSLTSSPGSVHLQPHVPPVVPPAPPPSGSCMNSVRLLHTSSTDSRLNPHRNERPNNSKERPSERRKPGLPWDGGTANVKRDVCRLPLSQEHPLREQEL